MSNYVIDQVKFRDKVDKLENLPAFPKILDTFNEMVSDPTISMNQIGDLIAQDQTLAMKILKLVNSAFYGFPGRISTVTHALVLLGYDVVKGLILSASVFDIMLEKWSPLWKHSMGVSRASGLLCKKLEVPNAEEISMAGLLHDIGKVVIMMMEEDIYQQIMKEARKKRMPLHKVEEKRLGFNHADVASWLCERWHLPDRLSVPLAYHHKPSVALATKEAAAMPTAVVFYADNFVKALGGGTQRESLVDPMPPELQEFLPLEKAFMSEMADIVSAELESLSTS